MNSTGLTADIIYTTNQISNLKQGPTSSDTNPHSLIIAELFRDDSTPIPIHIRTGQQSLGSITERDQFHHIEFHGYGINPGTARVRVYIDGRYVCDDMVTLTEAPNKTRRTCIPVGQQNGYSIDVELAGHCELRAIEFCYTPMPSTS